MKKYLCFLLILTLLFTMIAPVSIMAAPSSDLFEYLYEKQVNPYMFSGTFGSFISYENIGEGYKLRSSDDIDMICEEISVFLNSYGVTNDELLPYVTDFMEYFSDKEELFNIVTAYVINTSNIILPFTKQDALEEAVPVTLENIRESFYSETLFLNVLSSISQSYQENKSDMPIKLVDDTLIFQSDVASNIDILETEDRSLSDNMISKITEVIDNINGGDTEEKNSFADYLVLIGILSLKMDDTNLEDDPVSILRYEELKDDYENGNEYIDAFYPIDEIVDEFENLIKDAQTQFDKNKITEKAMTKATTIRVKASEAVDGGSVKASFNDEKLIEFAALCGKVVRNELIKKGISVSKNQTYSFNIEIDDSADFSGISVEILESALKLLENKNISSVNITSPVGGYTINIATFIEKALVSGRYIKFEIMTGSAEEIIPGLEIYAQGNEVIKLSLSGNNECSESIPYGVMYFVKNVEGKEDEYGENNIYSIANDGEREKVLRYSIVDEVVRFEIGEGRYFAKIEGELTKPNPEVTPTPTPSTKPGNTSSNTSSNTGSVWVDDTENNTDNNSQNDVTDNGNTQGNEENNTDKPVSPDTEKEINFTDVSDSHWAKDYIINLASKGILSGIGDNKFAPDANVTREQFAKILTMAFDIVNENAQCDFSDVDDDSWYKVYVASAYEKGIINGIGEGLFGTGQNISRQDMATMIVRAAEACNIELGEKSEYVYNDDGHISEYAFDAVKILAGSGAVSGYEDNSFRPKNPSTRAQVAKIISEILKYKN